MPRTTPPVREYFGNWLAMFQRLIKANGQQVTKTHRDTTQYLTDPNTGLTGNVTSSASGNSATLPTTSTVFHHGQIPMDFNNGRFIWDDALGLPKPLHGSEFHDTNPAGNNPVRLHVGTQPETDSSGNQTHGMWVHDHSGNVRQKSGGQLDGTTGTWHLDANGDVILKTGQISASGIGSSGFNGYAEAVYRSGAGDQPNPQTPVVLMGQIPDGQGNGIEVFYSGGNKAIVLDDNGLATYDQSGNKQAILPVQQNSHAGAVNTTSTSYQGSDQVSVSCYIGGSGSALVQVSAFVSVNATNATGSVGLFIDGTVAEDGILSLSNNAGGSLGLNCSAFNYASGLSQGDHTFGLRSKTSLGSVTVTVSAWVILIQPL